MLQLQVAEFAANGRGVVSDDAGPTRNLPFRFTVRDLEESFLFLRRQNLWRRPVRRFQLLVMAGNRMPQIGGRQDLL